MGSSSSSEGDLTKTSPPIIAQNELLNKFCGDGCHIESKTINLSNGYINYIEVVSKKNKIKLDQSSAVVSSQAKRDPNEKILVLTHGFGSGIGFFYPNFNDLVTIYDRVIAFDWLGMGSSSREPKHGVPIKGWLNASSMTPTKASDFFVDSLEEFRIRLGLDGFVLAGHSLGGYLAGRYAYKHPEALKGLVLISPAGIPPLPPTETHVKVQ
jgi:pimeloyl-ACP methyl ester carboxylesterase